MPQSLLFPLDQFQPTEILSQYSEWIYFTLILIFFISVAGITLKKHFDRPYVKPLIVSVGLMLTVGIFKFKHTLTAIFEGWGILGTILIVVIAATIPYGLSRGFGLSGSKAFYLTYILFYILSWVQFPAIYHFLGQKNLGLVNLALLIIFIVAIFKVVMSGKTVSGVATDLSGNRAFEPEINQEAKIQGDEKWLIEKHAEKLTKIEIRTIDDIAESLAEIQRIVDSHRNNLQKKERETISNILRDLLKKEEIFKKSVLNLRKIFQRIGVTDVKQLKEQKERLTKADGKERQILKAEISAEEKKLEIEKKIIGFEGKLDQFVNSFNKHLGLAVEYIRDSTYPYDAKPYLDKARVILKEIFEILKEIKILEENLLKMTKLETKLLNKEKEVI